MTFSGDTTYTDNIPTLAENTDLLIHEAVNVRDGAMSDEFAHHILTSHVEIRKVGPIAEAAGAKRLLLSHIGDPAHFNSYRAIDTEQWREWAQAGYTRGDAAIGNDLDSIRLA